MTSRRGFLASCIALSAAPAIVRADSLMRIVPRDLTFAQAVAAGEGLIAYPGWGHLWVKTSGVLAWPMETTGMKYEDLELVRIMEPLDV